MATSFTNRTAENVTACIYDMNERFDVADIADEAMLEINGWGTEEHSRLSSAVEKNFKFITSGTVDVIPIVEPKVCAPPISIILPSNCVGVRQKDGIIRALTTHQNTEDTRLTVVLDGIGTKDAAVEEISQVARETRNARVLSTRRSVGYLAAIAAGIEYGPSCPSFTGFIDDDATPLHGDEHFSTLAELLSSNSMLFATGGLAQDIDQPDNPLHSFFNTPNSYSFFADSLRFGIDLTKPHVHGGGGATLMRTNDFVKCLNFARNRGILLGPTISALGRESGLLTQARADMPVIHPTKDTLLDWTITTLKYYAAWGTFRETLRIDTRPYREEYLSKERDAVAMQSTDFQNRYAALIHLRQELKKL